MRSSYRNIFFILGIASIALMLWTLDMPWSQILAHVQQAGIWFPAVLMLWLPIYMMNAWAWSVIINDDQQQPVKYLRILKYTITGYALNYVTPVGVLGGEPYRIMELKPYVGIEKATSSVILYAMMHIFSHFCFWTFSIALFLLLYGLHHSVAIWSILLASAAFCALGLYVFIYGYRNGLVLNLLHAISRWPLIGKRIQSFTAANEEHILQIDQQIAALHAQRRSTFMLSLSLEFIARIVGCLELLFILFIFTDDVSFTHCILMQAFSSLLGNLVFFIPMQLGTREASMALFTRGISFPAGYGVLTGLVIRLRELVWICIGIGLLRVGNSQKGEIMQPEKH